MHRKFHLLFFCIYRIKKKLEEQELLINALHENFGIKATLNKRISSTGIKSYRIRISKKSMDKLIVLVKPYFIPEMLYKLGI
jgi:hypothetical protein